MQVESLPNKFKIFQDYYLYVNGEIISYSEALRLYSQLDSDTMLDFEKFYKDETGYEIITPNGYGLDYSGKLEADENGNLVVKGTKNLSSKKSTKVKQADGSIKWEKTKTTANVYATGASALKSNSINIKYTIEAYAKKSGKILDPQWSGYSAEEIISMFEDGVDIPQDIVDLANSILQTTGTNVEGSNDPAEEGDDETTEKEPYLDLIPKAKKKIEKCNDTNDKISDKINDLLPEKQRQEKNFKKKVENQKKSLDEYESQLREWRTLQNKVNNGEALSDSEAKRYAQITGMLEDKNNKDDMQFDKNEIARSLNDINILAVLGEKLAEETIEIGDTLADYTSQTNYKMTSQTVSHEIGFIGTIMAMAQGKNLAKEANKVGNETKEYSTDTTHSVSDIAEILGVQNSVLSSSELQNAEGDAPVAETNTQEADTPASDKPEDTVENENEYNPKAEEETKDPSTTEAEDFIINDENVKELIKEGGHIHSDLKKQTVKAIRNNNDAIGDKKFAKYANYKIKRIIKRYQDEEAKREEEIAKLEQENKEAKDKLEKLTGKSGDELDKEINGQNNKNSDDQNGMSESDKKEVENLKSSIQTNNQKIGELKEAAQSSIDEFKNKTNKEKSRISSAVPSENQNLEANTEYKEKEIPQDKEALNFTDKSGETLTKMGKYRVIVGLKQIASLQFKKGFKNFTKGSTSTAIGFSAQIVGSLPTPKIADKATTRAIRNETSAIEGLNQADAMISSITGEETTQSTYDSNKQAEQDQTAGNTEEGAQDTADGTDVTGTTTTAPAAQSAPAQQTTSAKTTESTSEGSATGAATPIAKIKTSEIQSSTNSVEKAVSKAQPTVSSNNKTETPEEKEVNTAASATTSTSSKKSGSKKEEMTDAKAQDTVDKAKNSAKDSSKDSENVKKDTDKTTKELEKETKKLTKQLKKDEKEIIKMTKESERAAKKQEEMVAEYEAIVAENEQLTTEDMNAQRQAQIQGQSSNTVAQADTQSVQQTTTTGSTATQGNAQTSNADKIASNDARLNEIGVSFEASGRVITRNRTKIKKLQKSTKVTQKKVTKKTKVIEKKNKEAEKKEQDKQKKLAKQLGAVGIAENQFSITLSTGTILLLSPWTHAVGQVMVTIGTYGVAACGVTKGVINLANGNLTAALMSIGQAAITVASSQVGVGSAAGGVLGAVTSGLNVVASSADMVNNIRAVQGKEASGVFSKISAIAGAASAITSAASTLGSLGQSGTFGQIAKIGSVVGSVMSSTSQLMTSFGSDSKFASVLGAVGGAISMAASIGMLADNKMNKASEKNKENKEKTESTENNNDTNSKDKTDSESEKTKEEQKKETEESKAKTEIQKAEQTIKTEENKDLTDKNSKTTAKQEVKEKTPKEQLKEAKEAREDQKTKAKESNLDKDAKKNMTENGASKEYADISDEELAERLEFAQEMDDKNAADKFSAELKKRGDYKDKMALISEHNAETKEKVIDAVGKTIQGVTSVMNMNNGKQQDQKEQKKYIPANYTKRMKEIIKKNRKRIAALAKRGH